MGRVIAFLALFVASSMAVAGNGMSVRAASTCRLLIAQRRLFPSSGHRRQRGLRVGPRPARGLPCHRNPLPRRAFPLGHDATLRVIESTDFTDGPDGRVVIAHVLVEVAPAAGVKIWRTVADFVPSFV